MIIKIEYDKSNGTLNLTKDEEIVAVINNDTVVDDSNTLSFEIALDVSQYQEQFNEIIDGNNNE
tara:strand:+ start:1355 stop:1546 length:192 start_codon:yes stop_codon:yes gene_type:complete